MKTKHSQDIITLRIPNWSVSSKIGSNIIVKNLSEQPN